ncbi:MAG: glucans biosynthesis glucosyltransferase MdoH [Rhizobiales bacterium]|nr:glucans biosynthesis glucosyltransferase MdoH [Hyphomicrobiales bacterium]
MVVPVDEVLSFRNMPKMMPAETPLDMPTQRFDEWPPERAISPGPAKLETRLSRLLVFTLTLAITAIGTFEMYEVIRPSGATRLQIAFAALFALTFAWIAFACASALVGFFRLLWQRNAPIPLVPLAKAGRTALLMPVYNENPERVLSTLEAMARSLVAHGAGRAFDVFILSDTRENRIAAVEEAGAAALKQRLAGRIGIYYRRRAENKHKKAGNIADFVTRWGGAYESMVVLDADSYMDGRTLITLARAMAADPKLGIIQTLPLLHNRWTLYARMQQFAGRVYGPVIAAGLAAWHGEDGNYWGHNAIIRVKAFAGCAGLPELNGRKPFGGHILSHDFVEAALIRRGGWKVVMYPQLGGSYEETPPSLIELAGRDRRWCQGNLQHMKIVFARGLHWASRVHLIQGIMSYLASPLWLLLLIAGFALAVIAKYAEPNYFPEGFSLFPVWPVFDPDQALELFAFTAVILYLPKLLGVVQALGDKRLRRGCGGVSGLMRSLGAEVLLSALLSPVMMLIQSRFVAEVFLGRDSGWNAQTRDDVGVTFSQALRTHWLHTLIGIAAGSIAYSISWTTFAWFSPIVAGLFLSIPISWLSGRVGPGVAAYHRKIFLIPEERAPVSKTEAAETPATVRGLEAAE